MNVVIMLLCIFFNQIIKENLINLHAMHDYS